MAGAGSALDRNDYQLIEDLVRQVGRLADEVERLNDGLEDDDAGYPFRESLEARKRMREGGDE